MTLWPVFLRVAARDGTPAARNGSEETLVACLLVTRPWYWPLWWAAKLQAGPAKVPRDGVRLRVVR